MKAQDYKISSEKFVLCADRSNLHDKKLDTKPVSYFRDAFNRFCRNKASILAAIIIGCLFLFAIIGPIVSPFTVSFQDEYYKYCRPRSQLFYDLGWGFWDGGTEGKNLNEYSYLLHKVTEQEIGRPVFMSEVEEKTETYMGKETVTYSYRYDTYNEVGIKFVRLTTDEYKALQEYQDEKGIQVIYPITDPKLRPSEKNPKHLKYVQDIDKIWFRISSKGEVIYDKEGNLVPIYMADKGTDMYTSKMLIEGDTKEYSYAVEKDANWELRVDYREYFTYLHYLAGDGITEPSFLFGTNNIGKDLFTCLASGARFSFILAIVVATVNLFVGAIYGAIEGYYGGKLDMFMERFVELLTSVPFMIVITLMRYHLKASHIVILFIAFFLTGWTGMAGRTRMQFYRFKNQEYVLVARTLGARDRRIMFKHIFPNAVGTLITSSVLVIPGVIFSETSLSYLGIINLSTGSMTSVGTLLAAGQGANLYNYPHMIVFPALFISLLMLSFNLFGNGLRDAFNPSLRGTED